MDGDDETDDESAEQQGPRADPGDEAGQRSVDGGSHRASGSRGEAKKADQGDDRDGTRDQVYATRAWRFGPQQRGAQRDHREHGREPRGAEGPEHAVADPGQDRAGVAEDRE